MGFFTTELLRDAVIDACYYRQDNATYGSQRQREIKSVTAARLMEPNHFIMEVEPSSDNIKAALAAGTSVLNVPSDDIKPARESRLHVYPGTTYS
jgi:hypothetical protein